MIAVAVVLEAHERGVGRSLSDDEAETAVSRSMWFPEYLPYFPG
jgi:hypothetical protein